MLEIFNSALVAFLMYKATENIWWCLASFVFLLILQIRIYDIQVTLDNILNEMKQDKMLKELRDRNKNK